MGRGTQLFEFLKADPIPTALEIQHHYTSLMITDELKKFRRKWRKENKDSLFGIRYVAKLKKQRAKQGLLFK